ncbi:DUF3341 domain-containing protein [Ancylobacter sp. MQZ15Z-1]|uniref:DUF3341 domain-containing protein n=1 Tax=Ancylobacter mangrovi TaxID=2972472 RepID=A0A9X2PGA9_9HYPH|nr:DUF3341 domain-containing protein [Ancylobacter mangrovi]MCS0493993.1 DUF3341 domain-containing protein [Ancylobacter mangrovi]
MRKPAPRSPKPRNPKPRHPAPGKTMPRGEATLREPTPHTPVFGLMAEFSRPETLVDAIASARKAGFRRMDAYSPFPVEGAQQALGFEDNRVPWLTLAGGVFGAALGYGMQVYTNAAYPIDIGGRPLFATPAFMLITFELMVLFAVIFSIGGMLALNRLPRLHHPVFDIEAFHLASSDKFFLVIFGDDPKFDDGATRRFLEGLEPVGVALVRHTEAPE